MKNVYRMIGAASVATLLSTGPSYGLENKVKPAHEAHSPYNGDTEKGERLFRRYCGSCHTVKKGGRHRIGPNLNKVYGSIAGTQPKFKYSKGMKKYGESGGKWHGPTLDKFLENPRKVVKGTRMTRKVRKKQHRVDIISYLKKISGYEHKH